MEQPTWSRAVAHDRAAAPGGSVAQGRITVSIATVAQTGPTVLFGDLVFYLLIPRGATVTAYLGKGLKTVRMTLFHRTSSAQESAAESERIFRGAASPGTERNRPADGQQQGGVAGGHDRVRDAPADHVRWPPAASR